ncbi:MoaD/ThiS family protein [Candidatus Woesearchaeota archaeon]|nr:MoaD/ThiS family protein [Candidatus Woesearchaeota archaeon]MBI2581560.1 MoaD/ThiS family protein [Candidatus Woesearchaeota archaeon]
MYIEVYNEREQTTTKVEFIGTKVKDLLRYLRLNPEAFLVVRNHEVITEEEVLQDQDKIELLSVISGG